MAKLTPRPKTPMTHPSGNPSSLKAVSKIKLGLSKLTRKK
jgi:hypothetical protein